MPKPTACARGLPAPRGVREQPPAARRRAVPATVVLVTVAVSLAIALTRGGQAAPASPGERIEQALAVLASEAPLEEKHQACRELAVVADGSAVPRLAGLLGDPDLAHMARYALEPIPDKAVDEALRDALNTLDGEQLVGVVRSIGVRRDDGATGRLGQMLQHTNADVAAAAADTLGRIASLPASEALRRALVTVPPARRPAVAAGCLACAEGFLRRNERQASIDLHDTLRTSELPEHQTTAATRGAILARGDAGIPLLVDLLVATEDDASQALAMHLVREMPGSEVLRALSDTMVALHPQTQIRLIAALSDRGDPAAREAVSKAAGSPRPDVSVAAIKALATFGDASSIRLLLEAAGTDDHPQEAEAALASLRLLAAPGADAAIASALADVSPKSRARLIEVLADRHARTAVPELLEHAGSPGPAVSEAAFSALGSLAEAGHLPQLVTLLAACPHQKAQTAAARAVAAVAKTIPDIASRCDTILAALKGTEESVPRCLLLRALAAVANFQAFDVLRTAVRDSDADVRSIAVRALSTWPDATPASTLLELTVSTADPVHRTLAFRGVVRMAGMVAADCDRPTSQVMEWLARVGQTARSADEKKLLLSGLAVLHHPAILPMVLPYLDDNAVRSEAGLAVVRIASAVGRAGRRDAAEAALAKVIKTVKDPAVRKQAEQAVQKLAAPTEFIVAWQVCGPYTQGRKKCEELYPVAFPPEQPDGEADWSLLAGTLTGDGKVVNLHGAIPGSHRVAYVRTWLVSEKEQPGRLEMGFDDGGKAWLNGEAVVEANTTGACVPGKHRGEVTLRKGRNLLFLKLTQHTGPWQVCVRLVGPDGEPLPDVTADAMAGEEMPVAGAAAVPTPKPDDADFSGAPAVPLFDGKTLEGWEGGSGCFRVQDGAIVGGQLGEPISVSDYLCTTRAFGDFELTAEVRTLGPRTNGGIQFRGARIPNSHAMTGFQADVCDNAYWGCLYDCARNGFAARVPQKELSRILRVGDWNEYRVRAVGNRIRIWLNGYRTVDWTETDPKIPTKGVFGLQTHQGPPGEGWYRNIMVREL